ncbi:MAG: lipid A ethanolaminephosphotransferase [Candidatus Midichloriaceae bacterium]|jgi:lipid A ethanolaminephosphotransferase
MKKLIFNKYSAIILCASSLLILFNIIFIKDLLIPNYKMAIIMSSIGFSIFVISITFVNRIFFIPFFIILIFFGSILTYFKIFFGIRFNESLLECTLNTNYDEASTFLSYKLIGWMVVFWFAPSIILMKVAYLLKINLRERTRIVVFFCFIGSLIFYSPQLFLRDTNPIVFLQTMAAVNLYPANFITTIKTYYIHEKFKRDSKEVDAFTDYKFNFHDKGTKIVLVIGESARSDRFGINNYSRDTTPNLAKQDGVVSFKEAYSLATYTILGVQNIFKIHPYINENTIISAFNKLGFKSAWITIPIPNQIADFRI